ncbi:MAG TPA: ATP-dependent endonuclease [Clostridia bacterium]|nr:ATP-dependent endonuclease [Clostridia bacterium]
MKLKKIQVYNYRLLKDLDLDIEENLSLIIGKNNCGKTSLLSALDKFIGGQCQTNNFFYDDFNADFKNLLYKSVEDNASCWDELHEKGIVLQLYIQFDDSDNLSNIRPLMLDLDPCNNMVILRFEYVIDKEALMSLSASFQEFYTRFSSKPEYKKFDCFENFIGNKHRRYFKIIRKTVLYDYIHQVANYNEFRALNLTPSDIREIVAFKSIGAHRDTENKDHNEALSGLSSRYYEKTKPDEKNPIIQGFEDTLYTTDSSLTEIYQKLFKSIIEKIKRFGGIKENETVVKIISSLSQQELLKGNTTVVYEANEHHLPESYNGLGYLNLISMIIEIETLLSEFRIDQDLTSSPANINLLFIEEPEAHTHPQMQYIFIKNIKALLQDGISGSNGKRRIDLQTIITTHSSHIVSECDFDDIKYFKRITQSSVVSMNLKELEIEYKSEHDPLNSHFKFLKQYLTLNYAEIFFADKAILYEGETERILLPAIMKKLDEEEPDSATAPLLSQNISLIESGAYSQIFDRFLTFIGIRTLIITDIDSGENIKKTDENGNERTVSEKCPVEKGTLTTNGALKHYYKIPLARSRNGTELDFFTNLTCEQKALKKENEYWTQDISGNLMLVYQINESGSYHPRSFEDAFLSINHDFLIQNLATFNSLKNTHLIQQRSADGTYQSSSFELADKCISSKSSFALDILINSIQTDGHTYSNWNIPSYIKEGLVWMRKG